MIRPVTAGIPTVLLLLLLLFNFSAFSTPLPDTGVAGFHPFSGAEPLAAVSREPMEDKQGHKGLPVHSIESIRFPDIPEVARELEHYSSGAGRDYLIRVLNRGETYLTFINRKVQEIGLPWELAYLPIIESAFIPDAVSRSGATGLWQFMMNSISPYDMSVNEWMDERRDFWKASTAALRKLKTNYDILGDWLLAIGAYNCGLGAMQRAVAAAGSNSFWDLSRGGYIPVETQSYVPRFLAVSHLASYPGRYGLPVFWDAVNWTRITVTGPVHLNRLAEAAGVPLKILADGNKELNQPITPPLKDGYKLKIPEEYADKIRDALGRNDLNLVDVELYTIKNGDTLYALSRHYGISVDLLLDFNPDLSPRNLCIGSRVAIPLMQPMPAYIGATARVEYSLYSAVEFYTVKSGDTLTSIGKIFGTNPGELAHNNEISLETTLQPGMILKVPSITEKEAVQ